MFRIMLVYPERSGEAGESKDQRFGFNLFILHSSLRGRRRRPWQSIFGIFRLFVLESSNAN